MKPMTKIINLFVEFRVFFLKNSLKALKRNAIIVKACITYIKY